MKCSQTYFIFTVNEAKVFQSPRKMHHLSSAHLGLHRLWQTVSSDGHNFYWTVAWGEFTTIFLGLFTYMYYIYTYIVQVGMGMSKVGKPKGDKCRVKCRRHLYKLLRLPHGGVRSTSRYAFLIAYDICMTLPRPLSPFYTLSTFPHFYLLNIWLWLFWDFVFLVSLDGYEIGIEVGLWAVDGFLPWLFGICTTQSLSCHGQVLTTTSTAKTKTTNYKLTLSQLHFRRHKFHVRRHDRANKKYDKRRSLLEERSQRYPFLKFALNWMKSLYG